MNEESGSTWPAAEMDRVSEEFDGRMGFYVEDLHTGQTHGCYAEQRFPTASVCKIPVMVELFRQVEKGMLSLDERRRLEEGISTHGSGTLSMTVDRPELSLRDYCRLMIGISDNMATDMVMSAVGLKSINACMDQMGYPNIRTSMTMGSWHYGMAHMEALLCNAENDALFMEKAKGGERDYDSLPYTDSPENNVAAPGELGRLVGELYRGRVVSAEASAAMVEMLGLGTNRTMICRDLDPGIEVAHKYGSSGRIKGDAGILFLPDGPLVIAAFALAATDQADGAGAIARVSRLAVEALSPESIVQ